MNEVSYDDASALLGLTSCGKIIPVEKPDSLTDETLSYRGNLSQTGLSLTIPLGGLTIVATRLDSTTVTINATSSSNAVLYVTRVATGPAAPEAWRKTITLAPSDQVDEIGVGSYIIVDYYITYNDVKYHVVAGSDDDNLSIAWVDITKAFELK